jgi:hypothetical protein
MVECEETEHPDGSGAGSSGADTREQCDGAGGAQTVSPAEVQVQWCLSVAEQEADPGHTADGEVGSNHLYEGPLLQVLSLDDRIEHDRRPSGDKSHPQFDVLNRWTRESPLVESTNFEECLPPYGPETSPERSGGARGFLVDMMVKKVADRRNVAWRVGLVVIGAEDGSQTRVGPKCDSESLEGVGVHLDVGVDKNEHVSCRLSCSSIPGLCWTCARRALDDHQLVRRLMRPLNGGYATF